MDIVLFPVAVAEGLPGESGKLLVSELPEKREGQMPQVSLPRHRFLGEARRLEAGVEELPVGQERGCGAVDPGTALLFRDRGAYPADEPGQVDASDAGLPAGLAVEAVLDQIAVLVLAVHEIGQHQADGPDVDVAVLVSPHQPVNGAHIGAGPAADAAQGLGEDGVLRQGPAAVVQEDDVGDLAIAVVGQALRVAGDPGDVGGDGLPRGVAGQPPQDGQGLVHSGDELVQAGYGHVHPGEGGNQARIALVAHDAQGAGLGQGEVGSGDTHVRVGKALPELATGHLDQVFDVIVLFPLGNLCEEAADLVPGEMDRGHDHVTGALPAELDDPLPEVRLHNLQADAFQMLVEVDLLGGHGLGLDHALAVVLRGDSLHKVVGLAGGAGQMDPHALGFSDLAELLEELHLPVGGIILDIGDALHQAGQVDAGKVLLPAQSVRGSEVLQGLALKRLLHCLFDFGPVGLEGFAGHGGAFFCMKMFLTC